MAARDWLLGMMAAAAFACGSNGGSNGDANGGNGDGGGEGPDAFESTATCGDGVCEAGEVCTADCFSGACSPTSTAQCSNCIDDDGDTKIDGFDPECSGPLDDREDSFATGIPGDNMDATYQDCFFDGDSGGGNDGCSQHICCLLQAGGLTASTNDDISECMKLAPGSNYNKYERSKCYAPFGSIPVPSKCTMNCGPLSPPGCDCFGCCTVCNQNGCEDIAINPAVSPNCDQNNVTDPGPDGVDDTGDEPCKRCVKNDQCGSTECAYDGVSCTPCPGQCDAAGNCNPPLPSSCGGNSTCPQGYVECAADGTCPAGTYCSSGCCVGDLL